MKMEKQLLLIVTNPNEQNIKNARSLQAHSSTRMNTSEIVVSASSSLGITLLLAVLVASFPVLLLRHLLRGALALVVQFLVLSLDLGLAVFGFSASTGTAASISTLPFSLIRIPLNDGRNEGTHVSSTLILRGGYFPSLNVEWWYNLRQVFMRSKFSNSMNAKPRHFVGLSFSVATRIETGGFLTKCSLIDSLFAE